MIAGMAVGGAVGQNIAGTMNRIMAETNQAQPAALSSPPPVPPPPIPVPAYHVAVNGTAAGPFDINTLTQMAGAGGLFMSSLVWRPGMPAWSRADAVDELKDVFQSTMPPVPSEK